MSKFLFLFFGMVFIPLSSLASPAIGDRASFSVTTNQSGVTKVGSEEWALVDFNPKTLQFKKRITTTQSDGTSQVQEMWIDSSSFYSNHFVTAQISHCEKSGGTSKNVSIPAGTFSSCGISLRSQNAPGTLWLGYVPFGVLKLETNDSRGIVVKTLSNYHFGQE